MASSGIKGSAIESLIADVNTLIEQGRISPEEIESSLTADDLAILQSKIQPALWYALDSYARLTQLLLVHEGHGDFEYLRERGRRAAQRIVDSGLYSQLSDRVAETWSDRVGRMMVSVGPAMFRDTEWVHLYVTEPGREEPSGFRITMKAQLPVPEICRHAVQGFIERMTARAVPDLVHTFQSACPTPNTMVIEARRTGC